MLGVRMNNQTRTPLRTRAAFFSYLLIGVSLWCVACAQDQAAEAGGYVSDCQPCQFMIGENLPQYQFFFVLESSDDGRVVDEIVVKHVRGVDTLQRLIIDAMHMVPPDGEFFFEAKDINFDGDNDLSLIVEHGVANSYAKYWLFDRDTQRFNYLDEFPLLTVDRSTKTLSSYERGGHGGMIFEWKKYQVSNGGLQIISQETQDWVEEKQAYLNTVRVLKGGRLSVVEEKVVHPRH